MAITKKTLQAMIREFHGIELPDEELEQIIFAQPDFRRLALSLTRLEFS